MKSHRNLNGHILIVLGILALLLISVTPVVATGTSSPLLGTLQVSSTPSGAKLVLDNVNKGTTPVTVENILAGSHTISLSKDGYYDYTADIAISGGKTTTVSVPLASISAAANGTLFVNSTPSGATVIIDDIVAGFTPATFKNIIPGDHIVTLTLSGYDDYTETVSVMSDTTSTVNVDLAKINPAPGSVRVTSTPSLATVYLDNVNKGTTPLTLDNVGAGSHTILLRKIGYNDYRTSINVISGKTVTVSATLTVAGQKTGTLNIKSIPSGATISLDGVNKGSTPMTISNILAGSHALILKKTGYQDYKAIVLVVAGRTTNLSFSMSKLPPTTGSITINSIPAGATILLDGVSKGTTNRTLDDISPGTHAIVVQKTGYVNNMTNVTVVAGKTETYTAKMSLIQATTGTIVIKSRPVGATVFLDSVNKGYSPITLSNIAPGIHSVILRAFNYKPYQTNVNVTAGRTIVLNITMTKN
ncbi:MAG TPA: PEGA domain-containing protein [Methanoregulaceae archaeon]|nr:PEGA domain-containing protein [Methanoregulaceae archaeon]